MDVYDRIGVPKLINAAGNNTNIGGSLMAPEVFEAMMEAGRSFVDLVELSQKVGAEIARLARVEEEGLIWRTVPLDSGLGTAAPSFSGQPLKQIRRGTPRRIDSPLSCPVRLLA